MSENLQPALATLFVPRLEATGMTTAEWTRGALMLEEPHFSKVKGIVCTGCALRRCPFNPRPNFDGLFDLMYGQYADRIEKGDRLLAELLSEALKTELKRRGIEVVALQMPSRKNPQLVFSFTREDKTHRVSCEVGRRRLRTDEDEETLLSLKQLRQKIEDAWLTLP